MADIELVIKIPEEEYNIIKKSNRPMVWAEHLIAIGTPLPEKHGRLIDIDEFEKTWAQECPADCGCCKPKRQTDGSGKWYEVCVLFDKALTVLGAVESEE